MLLLPPKILVAAGGLRDDAEEGNSSVEGQRTTMLESFFVSSRNSANSSTIEVLQRVTKRPHSNSTSFHLAHGG